MKAIFDCASGRQELVELTDAEELQLAADQLARAETRAAALQDPAREADLAIVREAAKTDPAFAALARLMGIDPVGNVVVGVDEVT